MLAAVVCAAVTAAEESAAPLEDWARYVDPMIGTGGHGHTFPGATLPFGMVQLSPDTRLEGWDGCSGYHDTDRVVYGFSHTHLSGTGVSDYGDILMMPYRGDVPWVNGYGGRPEDGYGSRFDKASEKAEAGYYAVDLTDHGVQVELTATERTGLHRYRFDEGGERGVLVDLIHRDEVLDAWFRIVNEREIHGYRRSTGWAKDQVVFFVARFSEPFQHRLRVNGEPSPVRMPFAMRPAYGSLERFKRTREDRHEQRHIQAKLLFGEAIDELVVKVGISSVDIDGARRNLEAEAPDWDFDATRAAARSAWNRSLDRIRVEGGSEDERINFYTALYHSFVAPNLASDIDGRYRGTDRRIHHAIGRRHYTVFSLWDTFRATHPLYTLIERERTREFIESFLAIYRQGGRLPVWELAGNETDTMIGYHAVSVIADAWIKGIRDFDAGLALESMIDSAERDHFGLEAYKRQGFIGSRDEHESVSKTLEYAYDDFCIARMAEGLGQSDVSESFDRRSQGWRHLLDPQTGFMRARDNQRWITPFDPARVDFNYTEANSWQYSAFVPHDLDGLIEAQGGELGFGAWLDSVFEADSRTTGRNQVDITGLIGQYAHGNEPSHHMAWLYHYVGTPQRSAERVQQILDELYRPTADGLSGNEDCGQMSSWYVLSAIGLFPVCPCTPDYAIGSPLFDKVTLRFEDERTFTIERQGDRPESGPAYVRSVQHNGDTTTRSFIDHAAIAAGGRLDVQVGAEPGGVWGVAPESRPRTGVAGARVLAAPYVIAASDRFRDTLEVELASADPEAWIEYRTACEEPGCTDGWWALYERPLTIDRSTTLELRARRSTASAYDKTGSAATEANGTPHHQVSPTVTTYLHRLPNAWQVRTGFEPNSQYTAGGPSSLVDGLRGPEDWRVGGWQGYQESDFEATVDLLEPRAVQSVGAGFLQDVRSWIWMPAEVEFEVSLDGTTFEPVGSARPRAADDRYGVVIEDLKAQLSKPRQARYIRVRARNYGTIPDWHPGRGNRAFIFVDELHVD